MNTQTKLPTRMRTFIHGTTPSNAHAIALAGFGTAGTDISTIWNCSDETVTYFRELPKDPDERNTAIDACIENGQIAAAIQGSSSKQIAIITVDIPEDIADEIVSQDNSCENMEDCSQIDNYKLNRYITSGDIKIHADFYNDAYMPLLRPMYLQGFTKNPNICIEDDDLYDAVVMINDVDFCNDSFHEHGDIGQTLHNEEFTFIKKQQEETREPEDDFEM